MILLPTIPTRATAAACSGGIRSRSGTCGNRRYGTHPSAICGGKTAPPSVRHTRYGGVAVAWEITLNRFSGGK